MTNNSEESVFRKLRILLVKEHQRKSWERIFHDLKMGLNGFRLGFDNFQRCTTITNGVYSFPLGMSGFYEDDIDALVELCGY